MLLEPTDFSKKLIVLVGRQWILADSKQHPRVVHYVVGLCGAAVTHVSNNTEVTVTNSQQPCYVNTRVTLTHSQEPC